jgi:hypothetical protein
VNWPNSLVQLKPLLHLTKLLASLVTISLVTNSLVMSSLVMSNNVMNVTRVLHNIVPHVNRVNHNMSAKKTPMLRHKLVVNRALNVKSCTSIPS